MTLKYLKIPAIETYIPQVIETESNDFVKISDRLSTHRNIRLLHAAMGIVTEITELFEIISKPKFDLINLREECGDATWYCGIAIEELKIDLADFVSKVNKGISKKKKQMSVVEKISFYLFRKKYFTNRLTDSIITAGNLLDLMKKGCYYNIEKLVLSRYEELLVETFVNMALILEIGEYTLEESFEINIAKLHKKRFKNKKFSEEEAINRNLTEERKTLENKNQ